MSTNECGCAPIKLYLQEQEVGQRHLLTPGLAQGALDFGTENQAWNSDFTTHYLCDFC